MARREVPGLHTEIVGTYPERFYRVDFRSRSSEKNYAPCRKFFENLGDFVATGFSLHTRDEACHGMTAYTCLKTGLSYCVSENLTPRDHLGNGVIIINPTLSRRHWENGTNCTVAKNWPDYIFSNFVSG